MKTYRLENALTINAQGLRTDAVARIAKPRLIRICKASFTFDFLTLAATNFVYSISAAGDDRVLGLVAFQPATGFLECANMEVADNGATPLYNGIGRAMVALCCQFSLDNGMDGFIRFEAKTRLFNYYERMGAKRLGTGLYMIMDTAASLRLTSRYF